jgi:hypothetical protein
MAACSGGEALTREEKESRPLDAGRGVKHHGKSLQPVERITEEAAYGPRNARKQSGRAGRS